MARTPRAGPGHRGDTAAPRRWSARLAREPRYAALAASFVTLVLVQGVTYTFPVFLLPLAGEFGGLRGVAAASFSVHNLAVGVMATAVDPLMARFGERAVLAAGALLLGTGVASSGVATSPLGIFLWFGLIAGLGAGCLGSVAQTVMLSRWFPRSRGTVNGLALSGMGIGMFLFAPLSGALIERFGWRVAFGTLGVGAAALLLPTSLLAPTLPADPPREPGRARATGTDEIGLARILPTFRFWCFAAAFFCTPISNMLVQTHQVAHLVGAGIDPHWAATAFGVVGLLSAVGRVVLGALSDRVGRVPVALLSYATTAAGTLALMFVRPDGSAWFLYAFILLFGLTLGARGPIISALAADVYGGRAYGPVLGLITLANRLGSAIGPWLGGAIYDLTGSYRHAFGVSVAALAVAALAFTGAGSGRPGPGSGRA
jgi:MFS family permease